MATGFLQHSKAKVTTFWGGIWQGGFQSSALIHNAGAPVNGTTGKGIAGPGAILVDTTVSGSIGLYQNTNTLASPTWTALTTATGSGTYTGTFDGVLGGNTPAALTATDIIATSGTFSGLLSVSVAGALTAIGTTAANSLALAANFNEVTTAATTAVGVTLPAATAGSCIRVAFPSGTAASIKIWPDGTDTIDAGGAGVNAVLTKTKTADFFCFTAGAWNSALLGATTS